jgi:DNA-binding NtrC family response regulator
MQLNSDSQIVELKLHYMNEILNLEEAKNALIKKTISKHKTYREAAEALGCSEKHLMNKLKEFKLEKQ